MTLGETLLNLTTEYQQAVTARDGWDVLGGEPGGREPSVIAAEYESTIRTLLLGDQSGR